MHTFVDKCVTKQLLCLQSSFVIVNHLQRTSQIGKTTTVYFKWQKHVHYTLSCCRRCYSPLCAV